MESEECVGVAPENLRLPRATPVGSVAWGEHETRENFEGGPSSLGLPPFLVGERCFGEGRRRAIDSMVDEIGHQNLAVVLLCSSHPPVRA